MISLKIQNLILIEKADITFGPSLNILTGETGSGKSAVLSAIRLIAGERADASCIRKGADLAVVEAHFADGTCIRREIHRSGKNRGFLNDELANLTELKRQVNIEVIDQNSQGRLLDEQKQMLDAYGSIKDETNFSKERELAAKLEELRALPKERELEWAQKDLAWIEEINWDAKEEEKLNAEHHLLTHSQELVSKMGSLSSLFTEEFPPFKRSLSLLDHCARVDKDLVPTLQAVKSALLELDEAGRVIQSYANRLEADPNRLEHVEKRIADFETLKKRFGTDIGAQKAKLMATLDRLASLDDEIASLDKELVALKSKNLSLANEITLKRKKAAPLFANAILTELKSLNLPYAKFTVSVGDTFNDVRFLFSANPGVEPTGIAECASGGELSRLFLSIKMILSDGNSMLVFDEIDSNVGGQTAAILGEKLKKLSKTRQVICVTHFVQVAKCALDHFLVTKRQKETSTYTTVAKLSEKEKTIEYDRMLGTTV